MERQRPKEYNLEVWSWWCFGENNLAVGESEKNIRVKTREKKNY